MNEKNKSYYVDTDLYKTVYRCRLELEIYTGSSQFSNSSSATDMVNKIKANLDELVIGIYRALRKDATETLSTIEVMQEAAEKVTYYLDLLHDVSILEDERFISLSNSLESIRKQLGGWRRAYLSESDMLTENEAFF